jgi:hypothetical protein
VQHFEGDGTCNVTVAFQVDIDVANDAITAGLKVLQIQGSSSASQMGLWAGAGGVPPTASHYFPLGSRAQWGYPAKPIPEQHEARMYNPDTSVPRHK